MSESVRIEIDMDQPCTRCGSFGASQRGLCLECIGKEIGERVITRKERGMSEQMSLTTEYVELTQEERIERGRQLADTLHALARMKTDHADAKKAMNGDEATMEMEIARLRDVVRSGREERPVGVSR